MTTLFTEIKQHWQTPTNYSGVIGRQNAMHLIQLRWIAVAGQLTTIAVVNFLFDIPIPTPLMLGILIFLIAFNIANSLRWHESVSVGKNELFLALLVDVATFTAQLYLSGGTQNPFAFLYLLQIILSAVLLDVVSTWFIIIITSACLGALSLYSVPLVLPHDKIGQSSLYAQGMVICFILNAALLTIFVTRISRNLRTGEAQLADLRQQTTEEDHIVRMGLLASGAAHELGTPLATLSVILGDWQRMPAFSGDPEIRQEMQEMQAQLKRCKSIISGILLSAGEVRSESSAKTTIRTFIEDLASEWGESRPLADLIVENRIVDDIPIAFNTALKQTIWNLLENAIEASPDWIKLEASCAGGQLTLLVADHGPGFSKSMLEKFGKPYQSSKSQPGHGLGLFFVVNVARKLGGAVTASNAQPGPGALVRLTMPLEAIRLESQQGGPQHG